MKREVIKVLKSAEFSNGFINYIKKNFPDNYATKYNEPFHMATEDNPMLDLDSKERLFESLAQLIKLKKHYENKGIPLKHLYESIYDLNYRIERYYKNNNMYGLLDRDLKWLSPMYKSEIFDIGSLRYQIFGFSYAEIERQTYQYMPLPQKWKERFPEGTPVINVHILKDTDLRPEKIDESFKEARDFFEKYFPEHDYEVFICRTWLLYGPTRDILSEDSNIAAFSKRFEIIASNQNPKQILDRVYGTDDLEIIKKMEKKSSLEKVAYKNFDKLGVAAGIIYK